MKILEMLPQLDRDALATVHSNAVRLSRTGTVKQKAQADEVLAHVEAEQSRRGPATPARPARAKAGTAAAKPRAKTAKTAKKAEAAAPSA